MNAPSEQPGGSRDPEHLERTADRIRADLDRTLDALERKLSPSQLLDRSLAYLREHGGDMARSVGETVRHNPAPIMLTVAGLGWLVAAAAMRSRNDAQDRPHNVMDDTFGDESPYADPGVRSDNFQDRVAATRQRLRSSRYRAANKFARAADATRERTRRAQSEVMSAMESRPLLWGGLAVAIGAVIGALIPATEYEDRTVGEVRDRAMARAKQMGERQYQNLRSRLETHRDLEVSGRAH
ncbi:MAG TPA: DUF3618 domain-containing protein [Steroidobacteraceae bacterium]|nr:DUF3618 domain-containing protein [Steroidobacteraceae bacterium]